MARPAGRSPPNCVPVTCAAGEEADFKGEDMGVYNALSAKDISINLLVKHHTFRSTACAATRILFGGQGALPIAFFTLRSHHLPLAAAPFSQLNVHGSWVRACFVTVRTDKSRRVFFVFFHGVGTHCQLEAREPHTQSHDN